MLILPRMTALATASSLGRARARVAATMRDRGVPVTLSIGAAAYAVAPTLLERALEIADAAMYEAKAGGRDRVVIRAA